MNSSKYNDNNGKSNRSFYYIYKFKVFYIFLLSYVIINTIYILGFRFWGEKAIVVFLTSPYNPLENFSGMYTSPFEGLGFNFLSVVFFLLFAEIYYRKSQANKVIRILPLKLLFLCSIIASYETAAIRWVMCGFPSSGTSVIGFSFLAYISFMLVANARSSLWTGKVKDHRTRITIRYYLAVVTVISMIALLYIVKNGSAWLHIAGGIFLLANVTVYLMTGRHIFSNKEAAHHDTKLH